MLQGSSFCFALVMVVGFCSKSLLIPNAGRQVSAEWEEEVVLGLLLFTVEFPASTAQKAFGLAGLYSVI